MTPSPQLVTTPYWWHGPTLTPAQLHEAEAAAAPVPATCDVAVIGAGYAGCMAALTLARAGRSVVMLDANEPGFGGSTRSGGMVGHGHRLSYPALKARHGQPKAVALLHEGMASLNFCVDLIADERLDAQFSRVGRFRGAWLPTDYDTMGREADQLRREVGLDVHLVPKSEQHREIATDAYHGGLLFPTHGGLHPAAFHAALLARTRTAGVTVLAHTPVTSVRHHADTAKGSNGAGYGAKRAYAVNTARGTLIARDVITTTNGYTGRATLGLARRLVPMPSYMIATEDLGVERIKQVIPNSRMIVETGSKHLYFRPSPDGRRIILGGRAALHHIPLADAAQRLKHELQRLLPQLGDFNVSHCWSGQLAFTRSDLPAIGRTTTSAPSGPATGVWYALGCNGSGVALMPYLGHKLALKVLGKPGHETAYDDVPFKALPLYDGTPWFQPALTYWWRAKDAWRGS
jgi:glycine/D-amino acid oxidase-like deaminating enzyme